MVLRNLGFPMLADYRKELAEELGILDPIEKVPLRATYLVDPDGMIRWLCVNDLSVGRSTGEILRVLEALQTRELCPANWNPGQATLPQVAVHAFLWEDGVMSDLGTLGGEFSDADGMNSRGQVVGEAQTASRDYHAFLWNKGVMTDLGTLGGRFSVATAINSAGQVAGWSERAVAGGAHAFLWKKGAFTDLGTLVADGFSEATALNATGQVVGNAWTGHDIHAFLWEKGVMIDLGTLGPAYPTSRATGINSVGQVVGNSEQFDNSQGEPLPRATLWTRK